MYGHILIHIKNIYCNEDQKVHYIFTYNSLSLYFPIYCNICMYHIWIYIATYIKIYWDKDNCTFLHCIFSNTHMHIDTSRGKAKSKKETSFISPLLLLDENEISVRQRGVSRFSFFFSEQQNRVCLRLVSD